MAAQIPQSPEELAKANGQPGGGAQNRPVVYNPPNTKLQKSSFYGYNFPVMSVKVVGGIRDHIHEYPHADGGAPEKMGRKLYTVIMEALFFTTGKAYPYLWPTTLNYLRTVFEQGLTGDLVIPTVGTIQAYCRSWTTDQTSKVLSGETAVFEFVEDQTVSSLVQALQYSEISVVEAQGRYEGAMLQADFAKEADISIFDAVSNAVNSFLAISDQLTAAGNLISAKLMAITDACMLADKTVSAQDPRNIFLTEALYTLWDTAQSIANQETATQTKFGSYVVPILMPISNVSNAIYGTSSRSVDIMDCNPIEDPMAIRAGTTLKYPIFTDNSQTSRLTGNG